MKTELVQMTKWLKRGHIIDTVEDGEMFYDRWLRNEAHRLGSRRKPEIRVNPDGEIALFATSLIKKDKYGHICGYVGVFLSIALLAGCAVTPAGVTINAGNAEATIGSFRIREPGTWDEYHEYRGQTTVLGAGIKGEF